MTLFGLPISLLIGVQADWWPNIPSPRKLAGIWASTAEWWEVSHTFQHNEGITLKVSSLHFISSSLVLFKHFLSFIYFCFPFSIFYLPSIKIWVQHCAKSFKMVKRGKLNSKERTAAYVHVLQINWPEAKKLFKKKKTRIAEYVPGYKLFTLQNCHWIHKAGVNIIERQNK